MKLKALLIALIVGPIVGYVISSFVLWKIFELANLNIYVSVADFDGLTTGVFFLTWLVAVYAGFRGSRKDKKKVRKLKSPLEQNITFNDVMKTFKPSIKNAMLEFIIVGEGKNLHKTMPYDSKAEYVVGDKKFTVDNDNIMIKKPSLFGKPKLVTILNSEGEPVKVKGGNKDSVDVDVTAEILSLAQRSGALGRTIKEIFNVSLPIKKILFFVILGVVGAVIAYVVFMGGFF
jgi:hypothetical protein